MFMEFLGGHKVWPAAMVQCCLALKLCTNYCVEYYNYELKLAEPGMSFPNVRR